MEKSVLKKIKHELNKSDSLGVVFATSDGRVFRNANFAESHAQKLTDGIISICSFDEREEKKNSKLFVSGSKWKFERIAKATPRAKK